MIHSANPDHSELAGPQSLYLGNRQQLAEVISLHPHFQYPNEIDLALNLGLRIGFLLQPDDAARDHQRV